jgi:hypothetical protein
LTIIGNPPTSQNWQKKKPDHPVHEGVFFLLFFFFQFCDVGQVAIIHKMLLVARFGYRLDMKVKKKKNDPSIFLATYWNLY